MKTLVLFAHPYFEHSTTNIKLIECYKKIPDVTFRDLYQDYPDFHIQPFRERKRIVNYDRLIFHFPMIWFGIPPLLKLWIDEVFDMRWIFENNINILSGKEAVIIATMGARENSFMYEGKYGVTVDELLSGLKVSLEVNHIKLRSIYKVYNADNLDDTELESITHQLETILAR